MTTLGREQILAKFQKMDEYTSYLDRLADETRDKKDKFVSDFHHFGTTERYLQLSIQTLIDIIQMLIVEENLKRPENNRKAISMLYNEKIISEKLSAKLEGIIGFRNILVHEYGEIDRERVYSYLHERRGDFMEFKREILEYLKD